MKYYCETCGTITDFCSDKYGIPLTCPHCYAIKAWIKIPDYETPEQYEERTGKVFPKNGLVWYRINTSLVEYSSDYSSDYSIHWSDWFHDSYREAIRTGRRSKSEHQIVIADPPVPPPDDWRPYD